MSLVAGILTMARDRCGYTHNVNRFPDVGETCCWRPVWEDAEYCIWHADVADKPAEALTSSPGDRLDGAILRGSDASGLGLAECTLIEAEFIRTDISETDFSGADLRETSFRTVNAQHATFSRANLETTLFRGVDLRGARLDQTKLEEVEFIGCHIDRATGFGDRSVYETQLSRAEDAGERRSLFESATWTYRTLQQLAHQNARRSQTYEYYEREQDLRRRFAWSEGYYPVALRAEASRWFAGYGHNHWRILGTSLLLIVFFGLLYPLTGGVQEVEVGRAITYKIEDPTDTSRWWIAIVLFKSLYFSVTTFATLGYGDFQPVGRVARALAGLEALFGALLMALLVVVLARRITWMG
jgi:hypothetical protein